MGLLAVGLLVVFLKKGFEWLRKGQSSPDSILAATEYAHECISGIFTWGQTKEECFKYLWELTDDALKGVAVMYEMRYGESLRRAVNGEWLLFGEWKDKLLERMADIGI